MGNENGIGKRKIKIERSQNADTRTCNFSKVTKEELLSSSILHIADVRHGMNFFSNMLVLAGTDHDTTKKSEINSFYKDFRTGFKRVEWWKMHQKTERHHLKDENFVQEDVNLIDILEMITDGVMAGLARSGEYRKEEIPDGLLRKAFDNTIQLLLDNVEIDSPELIKETNS